MDEDYKGLKSLIERKIEVLKDDRNDLSGSDDEGSILIYERLTGEIEGLEYVLKLIHNLNIRFM